jgi:hypothetical protein
MHHQCFLSGLRKGNGRVMRKKPVVLTALRIAIGEEREALATR